MKEKPKCFVYLNDYKNDFRYFDEELGGKEKQKLEAHKKKRVFNV